MDVRIFGSSRIEAVYQHHMYNFGFVWDNTLLLRLWNIEQDIYSCNQGHLIYMNVDHVNMYNQF